MSVNPMTYTRDLPTKPGWYWCKADGQDEGMIWRVYGGQLWDAANRMSIQIANTHYTQFAGPIEEPKT